MSRVPQHRWTGTGTAPSEQREQQHNLGCGVDEKALAHRPAHIRAAGGGVPQPNTISTWRPNTPTGREKLSRNPNPRNPHGLECQKSADSRASKHPRLQHYAKDHTALRNEQRSGPAQDMSRIWAGWPGSCARRVLTVCRRHAHLWPSKYFLAGPHFFIQPCQSPVNPVNPATPPPTHSMPPSRSRGHGARDYTMCPSVPAKGNRLGTQAGPETPQRGKRTLHDDEVLDTSENE